MQARTPETPMPIRKVVKEQLRKAIKWAMEAEIPFTEPTQSKHLPKPVSISIKGRHPGDTPNLKGKTTLVLKSLLAIHESIEDAEAWQGYEGTPDQLDDLRNQIYGILLMHPSVTDPSEVEDIWIEDYAAAELQRDMGWIEPELEKD